ncbi:hypothetical protein BJV77DRAFT_285009 [Russula vinacea]|nr:hypothetical protein BJV77DRAFT_285009 [Russula vinacea]
MCRIGNLRVSSSHELPRSSSVRNGVPLAHVLLLSATARTQPVQLLNHHATETFDKGKCLNTKTPTQMLSQPSRSSNDMMTMTYMRQRQRRCHLRHHLPSHHRLAHVKSLPRLSNLIFGHEPQKVKMLLYTGRLSPQVKMPCNARLDLRHSKLLTMLPLIVQVVELQRQRTDLKP